MNVELRSPEEEVLGKGTLGFETVSAIQSGDILKLEDDCFNIKGTFVHVAKVFKLVAGRTYSPNVVLYVEQLEP